MVKTGALFLWGTTNLRMAALNLDFPPPGISPRLSQKCADQNSVPWKFLEPKETPEMGCLKVGKQSHSFRIEIPHLVQSESWHHFIILWIGFRERSAQDLPWISPWKTAQIAEVNIHQVLILHAGAHPGVLAWKGAWSGWFLDIFGRLFYNDIYCFLFSSWWFLKMVIL